MNNLIFSLNATLPIFFTMILGKFFMKLKLFDDAFVRKMNRFVFKIALPVLLFHDLAQVDLRNVWDTQYVLFCFGVTVISITAVTLLSFIWKDRSIQGEFIQASYRSSAAILGIAFIQNIYGNSGMAPLMIIGTVPLYNAMAVIVLSFTRKDNGSLSRELLVKTLKGIITNPIILGIAIGLTWSFLGLPLPKILDKTVSNVAALATPLGLMAMGATFELKEMKQQILPAVTASFIKLIGLAAIFIPIAIQLGFREEKLIGILVMLGSASTVTCYVMAKNMGHEGTLSSTTVMITTLFSAFTLTTWLYILRTMGMI